MLVGDDGVILGGEQEEGSGQLDALGKRHLGEAELRSRLHLVC